MVQSVSSFDAFTVILILGSHRGTGMRQFPGYVLRLTVVVAVAQHDAVVAIVLLTILCSQRCCRNGILVVSETIVTPHLKRAADVQQEDGKKIG